MILRALRGDDWTQARLLYLALTRSDTIALTRSDTVAGRASYDALLGHPGTQVVGRFDQTYLRAMRTLHVLPNMIYGGRPYGLVENVVTAPAHRGQGHGRAVLEHVLSLARSAACYKVMLLTGKGRAARGFYEAVGFSAAEKWGMTLRF